MCWGSRGGQDLFEVSDWVLSNKEISLTARIISSLVIDCLSDQAREEGLVITWLYCDYNTQQEQTVSNMMGAILKRLVGSEIPEGIRREFKAGRRLRFADLMRMLKAAIASFPQVFICIDALDECLPKNILELLESLRDIVRESPKTRIFITGRPYVGEDIQRYIPEAVTILFRPNQDDIRNYVEMRLDRDADPESMTDNLRVEIVKIILDTVSDMCVGASPLSTMYTYQRLCVDSSLLR